MPEVAADLCIEVRWIAPMSVRNALLEQHSLVIRDGRILDILPTEIARERYAASVTLQRPSHLLMPGMINARADAALSLFRGTHAGSGLEPPETSADFARDSVLLAIAEMLRAGITCFSDRHYFPRETALGAAEQGIRVVVGMPVAEGRTPWASGSAQSMTHALSFRDEYGSHPLVSTVFAPQNANELSDATLSKLITLADELDAGIMIDAHTCAAEVERSLAQHGVRPLERLWKLGLLSPALNAVHMVQACEEDIALAQRTGISISVCLQGDLRNGHGLAPVAALAAAGIRLGLGSAGFAALSQDVWGEMRLAALLSSGWDGLHAATRGGAAVLGLDAEIGSLEPGKWADLCCLDLAMPAMQPAADVLSQLAFNGGRDLVRDVWVAGRQLLSEGELTRLDWSDLSSRRGTTVARASLAEIR
jgi:5-methylthioadenosine/S-adenosylhomocysteine deaminase